MSYVKIWVHLVFSTRMRQKLLLKDSSQAIYNHIMKNCRKKEIFLHSIGGSVDHIHCLISLGKHQSIAQVVQYIKGESSFWINQHHVLQHKFSWQDDYYAVSVSESHSINVTRYIINQEEHHRTKTFSEEVDEFLLKFGFKQIKDI